jgi:hypothetical protein
MYGMISHMGLYEFTLEKNSRLYKMIHYTQ